MDGVCVYNVVHKINFLIGAEALLIPANNQSFGRYTTAGHIYRYDISIVSHSIFRDAALITVY